MANQPHPLEALTSALSTLTGTPLVVQPSYLRYGGLGHAMVLDNLGHSGTEVAWMPSDQTKRAQAVCGVVNAAAKALEQGQLQTLRPWQAVKYVGPGVTRRAVFVGYDEGWPELQWDDGTRTVVRPSRVHPA